MLEEEEEEEEEVGELDEVFEVEGSPVGCLLKPLRNQNTCLQIRCVSCSELVSRRSSTMQREKSHSKTVEA